MKILEEQVTRFPLNFDFIKGNHVIIKSRRNKKNSHSKKKKKETDIINIFVDQK